MSSGLERGGHALTVLHPRGAWRGLTSVPQTVRGRDVSPAGRSGSAGYLSGEGQSGLPGGAWPPKKGAAEPWRSGTSTWCCELCKGNATGRSGGAVRTVSRGKGPVTRWSLRPNAE